MNKRPTVIFSSFLVVMLIFGLGVLFYEGVNHEGNPSENPLYAEKAYSEVQTNTVSSTDNNYGAKGAQVDDAISLEEMLTYAIQDEYRARAEYEKIMEVYGEMNPFQNIIKSEETHISMLIPLFKRYGVTLPEDDGKDHVVLPESLQVAYETGVNAELDNISMYEKFLQSPDLPADVKTAFTNLMNASNNHLQAFQKALNGSLGSHQGGKNKGRFGHGINRGL
ncbi:MAG: DUF2202 domain-containing protein [Thermicanus sp.]|nr:DUF2202 domain-containing protein [Thermicanus sp.]